MKIKICLCGTHGTGKSRICDNIIKYGIIENGIKEGKISKFCRIPIVHRRPYKNFPNVIQDVEDGLAFAFIPEQFREIVKDLNLSKTTTLKQTEEITLATYARQLYLENFYTAQGKNILCDRSVLDTFVYYRYFNKEHYPNYNNENIFISNLISETFNYIKTYSKIYLIEPSDREIEDDSFRLTNKKQQLEIHELFLEYFKDFDNVEIVNQEEANKPEFIEKVVREFGV